MNFQLFSISSAVTATNNTHIVYVADTKRHGVYQVELFDNGGEERLPLNFDVPVAVAHDVTSGNVYITERGRDSVRSRKYIYKWDQGRQQTAKVELPRCRYLIPERLFSIRTCFFFKRMVVFLGERKSFSEKWKKMFPFCGNILTRPLHRKHFLKKKKTILM